MVTRIDEVAEGIYRISAFEPRFGITVRFVEEAPEAVLACCEVGVRSVAHRPIA